jgi:UDP-galactopyranose mutase
MNISLVIITKLNIYALICSVPVYWRWCLYFRRYSYLTTFWIKYEEGAAVQLPGSCHMLRRSYNRYCGPNNAIVFGSQKTNARPKISSVYLLKEMNISLVINILFRKYKSKQWIHFVYKSCRWRNTKYLEDDTLWN